jgi:hypothetical protein
MNEPVYAFHLLKISRSFMQNFLYKIDKNDPEFEILDDTMNLNTSDLTLEECLENLTQSADFLKSTYK